MAEKPKSGKIFGVPYNFERPSIGRLLSSYWQPNEGMLVKKPFGIGYTLNLADWRSWAVLAVTAGLYWYGGNDVSENEASADAQNGPVEVVVED